MAPRGGPALPCLHAGPGSLSFPWWLECGLLHHPSALHPHCCVSGCLGCALWATGLWVLCQREDTSPATGGGARKLRQAHDQHLQGARISYWGGIGAVRMKIRKSRNVGFSSELGWPERWPSEKRTSKKCPIVVQLLTVERMRREDKVTEQCKKGRGAFVTGLEWI